MQTATARTVLATALVALLAAVGITAAIAADPAPPPPPKIAFLANGIVPADALAAGPIAGQLGAPIYTTRQETLSEAATTGLDSYDPELVIVLGGPVAISDSVIDQVEDATGLTHTDTATPAGGIVRAAGGDRFDTAAEVADLLSAYNPAYLPINMQAIDADTLDGKHADAFLPADMESMVPVAVLEVESNASVTKSSHRAPVTGEPTATSPATGEYIVSFPGVDFGHDDTAVCTGLGKDPIAMTTASTGTDLRVLLDYGSGGSARPFTCAVYKLS